MAQENQRRSTLPDMLGIVGVILLVAGPVLAWRRLLPGMAGFGLYALGGLVSLGTGLSALVASARGRRFGAGRALALLAAMIFLLTAAGGWGKPRINDFTTNTDDPPALVAASRDPANAGRDMAYPPDWAALQAECCADLRPAHLPLTPAATLERARAAAAAMPSWEIVAVDPAAGTVEAVATTRLFGFRDDIVIRVRGDGGGSVVDIRSKSRDGKGDLGANANRIRAFVEAIEATP